MRAVAGTTTGKRGNETDLYGAVFSNETDLYGAGIGAVVPGWTHKGGTAWGTVGGEVAIGQTSSGGSATGRGNETDLYGARTPLGARQ